MHSSVDKYGPCSILGSKIYYEQYLNSPHGENACMQVMSDMFIDKESCILEKQETRTSTQHVGVEFISV